MDLRILPSPFLPVFRLLIGRAVGRDAAMQLMKGTLAQQDDQLCIGECKRALERIEIDEPATRSVEPLIHPLQCVPKLSFQEQPFDSAIGQNQPSTLDSSRVEISNNR